MRRCEVLLRFFTAGLTLAGCTSFDSKMQSWVGHPIQQILDIVEDEPVSKSAPDAEGRIEYAISARPKDDCVIHFLVNQSGIIVGWSSEGRWCRSFVF